MTDFVFSERLFWSQSHAEKFGSTIIARLEDAESLTGDDMVYVVGDIVSPKGREFMDFIELMEVPFEEVFPELMYLD
jgi:hypothetical protein